MISTHNWKHYQGQLTKYMDLLTNTNNPYIDELRSDFRDKKVKRLLSSIEEENYKNWVNNMICEGDLNESTLDLIITNFGSYNSLKYFSKFLVNNTILGDKSSLKPYLYKDAILNFKEEHHTLIPKLKFNPTPLKFVTTTAIAYLDTNVDFKLLYDRFIPPDDIMKDNVDIIYNSHVVGKVVGCKTGSSPIKGLFAKEGLGDFYNCASLNVVLTTTKSANVKIFNNGKLQMTGIPTIEDGKKVCEYLCELLREMANNESADEENPLVFNKKRICLKTYKTVMINTCYEIGHNIDRETLYNIMLNRYNLNTIYDSEGYPGVRIEYYYNTNNIGHPKQGKCICSKTCTGKGVKATGEGEGCCRKISIAIFQSGSTIIAGGCKDEKPIYTAYDFINKKLKEIIGEIAKPENLSKKLKKKNQKIKYIEKTNISNIELYNKLISVLKPNKNNVELKIIDKPKSKKLVIRKK